MKLNLITKEGITQGFYCSPKNIPKLISKHGLEVILINPILFSYKEALGLAITPGPLLNIGGA